MELYLWICAIIFFIVAEALTAGLTSIWFALGSVAGLVTTMLGGNTRLQVALFLTVSSVALLATRPMVKRFHAEKTEPTNLDTVVGKTARVTEKIDNALSGGAVFVEGKTWTARNIHDGEIIPVGEKVTVRRIDGVKLIVEQNHHLEED